ncbi:MAG: hypothetical protein RLZZ519_1165 [Bacteroidota bacterium]|jgi:predicted nuclease of restriction endonuclease-like (RecB) superfamily
MESESMNYTFILGTLKEKIKQAKLRAVLSVNAELLGIYWEIGRVIAANESQAGWGAKIIDRLASDLKLEFPDMKGFSPRNLRYMREFHLAYPGFSILQHRAAKLEIAQIQDKKHPQIHDNQVDIILQQAVAKLPWGHHMVILDKAKETEKRNFYVHKCFENNWSRDVLGLQIENRLHLRQGMSLNNFNTALPALQADLAQATFKNPYIFDFLSATEEMQERDLENALIQHLKNFMLELGKGFAFVGNQFRMQVEGDEFILDLLFFNYLLDAFVLFELKLCDFDPAFAGKLNFYINAVDEVLKGPNHKPTIGVLLCKTPNATVVKYALKGIDTPMGISEYQLAEALPQQLKGEIPSIAELEAEMDKEYKELKRPVDQKLDRVKAMMRNLQQKEVKEVQSAENVHRVFQGVLLPLRDEILAAIADISTQFHNTDSILWTGIQGHETEEAASAYILKHGQFNEIKLEFRLRGCKPAGIKAFDLSKNLTIKLEDYRYLMVQGQEVLAECLYHDLPNSHTRQGIVEAFTVAILDDLEARLDAISLEGNS